MGQDEGEAGGLAGIGQPIPAEHAFGADGQVVTIRGDEFEEELEVVVFDVGVDEFPAAAVHEADVHLPGMEVDSAIELCGGGVILHGDQSMRGSQDPGLTRLVLRGVRVTLPAHWPHAIKNSPGLCREYQCAAANPVGASRLQSLRPVRRVAELGSLVVSPTNYLALIRREKQDFSPLTN